MNIINYKYYIKYFQFYGLNAPMNYHLKIVQLISGIVISEHACVIAYVHFRPHCLTLQETK